MTKLKPSVKRYLANLATRGLRVGSIISEPHYADKTYKVFQDAVAAGCLELQTVAPVQAEAGFIGRDRADRYEIVRLS